MQTPQAARENAINYLFGKPELFFVSRSMIRGRSSQSKREIKNRRRRCSLTDGATCSKLAIAQRGFCLSRRRLLMERTDGIGVNEEFHLPGESSDTGVLDGVGLCPGGRKCEGDPLLEPPPVAVTRNNQAWEMMLDCGLQRLSQSTHLHEDFDVKDYGHLDLVRRVAFHQHLALVLLSSSSCTSIGDFETKFSPKKSTNRDRWISDWCSRPNLGLFFCFSMPIVSAESTRKITQTACKQISL
jgi:hypothetical protein